MRIPSMMKEGSRCICTDSLSQKRPTRGALNLVLFFGKRKNASVRQEGCELSHMRLCC